LHCRHCQDKEETMSRYVLVSIAGGLLFAILDGLLNANPLARSLYEVFKPISRSSINIVAGITIDLLYGFAMAAIFLLLYKSLPGESGLIKGISFAALTFFLRVAMGVASQWVMFEVSFKALFYMLFAGMFEMLVLGVFYGLTLKPRS
jgi:hypothetical protein